MKENWELLNDITVGIITGLVFVSLIMAFCVILIRLYFNKIKNYTQLLYQKDLDFQKALTTAIIETQEQVLNNISQDLHDDAGQQLTSLNFRIESLRLDSEHSRELLAPLSQSVKELSDSIRGISHSLSNQLLVSNNLFKAIEAETERIQNSGRLTVNFSQPEKTSREFATNEKIIIYRIFQETISNILKHSGATWIEIQLVDHPFCLEVKDNGKGFNTEIRGNGYGLSSMANRAAIIAYRLEISSAHGMGTTVKLTEST